MRANSPFQPITGMTISIENGEKALPVDGGSYRIVNEGGSSALIGFGLSGLTPDIPVPAGAIEILTVPKNPSQKTIFASVQGGPVQFTPGFGGSNNDKYMSALRTKQAIDAQVLAPLAGSGGSALVGHPWQGSADAAIDALADPYWRSGVVHAADYGMLTNVQTDQTAALHAAWDELEARGGGRLILPPGSIWTAGFARAVDSNRRVFMTGAGRGVTRLRKLGATSAPVVQLSNTGNLDWFGGIADLELDARSVSGCSGLRLVDIAQILVHNVFARDAGAGAANFDVAGGLIIDLRRLISYGGETGIRLRASPSGSPSANLVTISGEARNSSKWGIDIGGGSSVRLQDVNVLANGATSDMATGGLIVRESIASSDGYGFVTLDNIYVEANQGRAGIYVEEAPTHNPRIVGRDIWFATNQSGRDIYVGDGNAVTRWDGIYAFGDGSYIGGRKVTLLDGIYRGTFGAAKVNTWGKTDASFGEELGVNGILSLIKPGDGDNRIGFFDQTPAKQQSLPAAASDPASTMALANALRTALQNLGLCT